MNLHPYQQKSLDDMLAAGIVKRGDAFVSTPRQPLRTEQAPAGTDPVAHAEKMILGGVRIEHIDEDGVIHFTEPKDGAEQTTDEWLHGFTGETPCACKPGVLCNRTAKCAAEVRGLNTDDFSQAPTIDADKSADWNRKAKAVKPGSFAARRMAAEE